MKKINTLLFGVILSGIVMTACNNNAKTAEEVAKPLGSSSGMYYPDSVLNKYVWRVFSNSNGRFVLPYNANITVDSTTIPPTLTTLGQAGSYTNLISINTKSTTSGTQELCSSGSTIGPDTTRSITYAGPFDPVAGHFYCSNGQLHYVYSTGKDSIITYVAQLIWMNQTGNGGGIAIGYTMQTEVMH